MLLVLSLAAAVHGPAAAADYRPLDRAARDLQREFLAAGGLVAEGPVTALLAVDPAGAPAADEALGRVPALPATADGRRLWLAKQWMHRGYLREAADLMARMGVPADAALSAERAVLQAEVLALQGRPAEAAALLEGVQSPDPWAAYARYNRAAALRAAGGGDRSAMDLLEALGRVQASEPEVLALRDRANIALGFLQLGRGDAAAAKPAFDRVRFDSPFSAEALFGLGWVEFAQGNLSRALIPWVELNQHRTVEPAVREALLLVPYAQWHIGAYRDAVQQYRTAIAALDGELALFDRLLAALRDGTLLDALEPVSEADGVTTWRTPAGYGSPYVHALLAQGSFQAAFETYRHLRALEGRAAAMPGAAGLRQRLAQAVADHRAYLQEYAAAEIDRHRVRSAGYRARAHFELARLLDEVAARGDGG